MIDVADTAYQAPGILIMAEDGSRGGISKTRAMLDPTLYRAKGQAMREDKRAVEAALPLWRLGAKLTARKESEVKP